MRVVPFLPVPGFPEMGSFVTNFEFSQRIDYRIVGVDIGQNAKRY